MKPSLSLPLVCCFITTVAGASAAWSEAKPASELPDTGKNVPRAGGGRLNVEAVNTRLVIKFFDADKKPVPPDADRGVVRFRYTSKRDEYAVLNREDDTLVTSARKVRPSHNFLVLLSLFAGEGVDATEFYTFKYP
ncbi:MAG: hypothetical protein PHE83_16105 [Opitutaceae bacterium]|nr:hypothetical protein [Opitutaceae bacterium]